MSIMLGSGNGFIAALMQATDARVQRADYGFDFAGKNSNSRPWQDGILWARARGIGGQLGSSDLLGGEFGRFENDMTDVLGGAQHKKFIGTSRDSAGAPLGGCVIQAYRTSDDAPAGRCVSDSGGYFECPTFFGAVAHYLVAYKQAGPDIAGTTVNTLIPV